MVCTRSAGKMMHKKYAFTLISIFTLFGAITGQADDVLPPRFNFDRYSAMVNHSPFAIATAIALPSSNAPLVPNSPTAAVPAVPAVPSPLAPSVPRQAPRPHVRGTIQRNPKALPMPTPNLQPPQVEQ